MLWSKLKPCCVHQSRRIVIMIMWVQTTLSVKFLFDAIMVTWITTWSDSMFLLFQDFVFIVTHTHDFALLDLNSCLLYWDLYWCLQVYPNSWTAILMSLDNAGLWNVRSALWERRYLGQEFYIKIYGGTDPRDELPPPQNALLCGKAIGHHNPWEIPILHSMQFFCFL